METKRNKVWKYILLGIYILALAVFMCFEMSGIRYPKVRCDNTIVIVEEILLLVVIPVVGLVVLFYKSHNIIKKVMNVLISIMLPVYLVIIVFLLGLGQGGVICSKTEDISDYKKFDKAIEDIMLDTNSELQIFPDEIPNNVTDIKYSYQYVKDWTPSYDVFLSFSCVNEQEYRKMKEAIMTAEDIRDISESDGKGILRFALIKGSDDATITYDDKSQRIEYHVYRN